IGTLDENSYFIFQNAANGTFSRVLASDMVVGGGGGPTGATARTQRYVTTSPVTVVGTDDIINCNIATPASVILPNYADRLGRPVTIKDVGPHAAANNITVSTTGGQLIDGISTFVIYNDRMAVTFNPFTDGTNTGWFIT